MGKTCKVVVCGQSGTGKTAMLEQLVYGGHIVGTAMFSTIEDIYVAYVDTDRNQKEKLRFYDTAGLDTNRTDLPKQLYTYADGYILLYDVTNQESFNVMDRLKKEIDKNKEKKEAVCIALGTKADLWAQKQVDFHMANKWAQRERVKLWEVSLVNRKSLMDPLVWLASRMTAPPSKSSFPLPGRKAKAASVNLDSGF